MIIQEHILQHFGVGEMIYIIYGLKNNQMIGYVGKSGESDGPHLHFEIWKNHIIIDPRTLIKEYKINDVSIE